MAGLGWASRTARGIDRVGGQKVGHSLGHEGIDGQPSANRFTHLAGGHSVRCERHGQNAGAGWGSIQCALLGHRPWLFLCTSYLGAGAGRPGLL